MTDAYEETVARVGRAWTAMLDVLPPEERELMRAGDTVTVYIDERPPVPMLRRLKVQPDELLLGAYVADPEQPTIYVYAEPVAEHGSDAAHVFWHEGLHRIGRLGPDHQLHGERHYDSALEPDVIGFTTGGCTVDCDVNRQRTEYVWGEGCPACQLHARLAEAERLGAGLAQYSTGAIPPGLGGTVPLMRQRLREAALLLPKVAGMLPRDDVVPQQLAAQIAYAEMLATGQVTAADAPELAAALHDAWANGYLATWHVFAPHPA